ncbi:MAG: hypothetical protein MK102_13275 [Fuerstiella sp.]|nr:hypothetical protein [Fuerstiella sp.]
MSLPCVHVELIEAVISLLPTGTCKHDSVRNGVTTPVRIESGLYRVLNLVLWFGLIVILDNKCEAHPDSHVDVWAQINTHLEFRVKLFLDDILASQGPGRQISDSYVTAKNARESFTQFDKNLESLLIVYDANGQRLSAEVVERPVWSPDDKGVDLEQQTGKRLTWRLRYPWNQQHKSFSVQHRLVEHDSSTVSDIAEPVFNSQNPVELRLRVRSTLSDRRIEAVIASHQPHTIVLPSILTRSNPRQNQTPTVAGLSLLPGQLTHEFTIPLVLSMDCIGLHRRNRDDGSYNPDTNSDAVRQRTADWIRNHFEISVDGRVAPIESLFVSLLTAENESINEADTVPLVGTRLGIRTTYRTGSAPKQLTASWTSIPTGVNQIQLHTISRGQHVSQLVDRSRENFQCGTLNYSWIVEDEKQFTLRETERTSAVAIKPNESLTTGRKHLSHELWQHQSDSSIGRLSMWIVLTFVLSGTIAGIHWKWKSWMIALMISLTFGSAFVLSSVRLTKIPDPETAAVMIQYTLQKAYRAVLVSGDQLAVEQLSEVFTDDMVESVFQQIVGNAERAPFVHISNVQVIDCLTENFIPNDSARFHCVWRVGGEILHWGHRHHRNLLLTGVIGVETQNGHCRICSMSLQHAEYNSDPHES